MKKIIRATLSTLSIGALGFLPASVLAMTHHTTLHPTLSASPSATAATMALRLFPSGTNNVILCSSLPSQAQTVVAAQGLATKIGAALLLTENAVDLGQATAHALSLMTVPQVSPIGTVQPYQPPAGKPTVTIVGNTSAISASLEQTLRAQGYPVARISGHGSSLIQKLIHIVAPPIPNAAQLPGFAQSWDVYAGSPSHNADFPVPATSPKWEQTGVQWNFAEDSAVPLNSSFPDLSNLGARGAPVKMTQNLGNAVGVTAVGGIIYAESDDYHLYALNARTGALLWQTGPLVNNLMGNPIVQGNMVYVTAGDTGFPFSQVLKYELSGGQASLVRGLMYSALYAFNRYTGRLVWRQDFHGNAMPSPVIVGQTIYEPTGGGNLWALNANTGQLERKTALGGFDSMSSPNVYVNPTTHQTEIIVGTSDSNHVVAVNATTGQILWTQKTALNIFNTGMGDNSPTVDETHNLVIQDSVVNFDKTLGTTNLAVYAMNATNGSVLWSTNLGVGSAPPAYKAGVSMVHDGIVYVGSPVTSTFYALNESTGSILWTFPFVGAGPAGAGRGNAVIADGVLWVAAGPQIYALNPYTGQELGHYTPGGRFGIVNPVIVGGTMYVDNSYDWVQAIPLKTIDPSVVLQP